MKGISNPSYRWIKVTLLNPAFGDPEVYVYVMARSLGDRDRDEAEAEFIQKMCYDPNWVPMPLNKALGYFKFNFIFTMQAPYTLHR